MLALPNSRLTSAGERQSALRACRYQTSTGPHASAYAASRSQKSRSLDKAITRMVNYSPKMGLVQQRAASTALPDAPEEPPLVRRATDDTSTTRRSFSP